MEKYNNFDAKGQVVFIEPLWVTGDTCLFNITNPIARAAAKTKLSKIRKDFILRLEKEGFVITYDKNYPKDAVCFIMDDTSICSSEIDDKEYKKLFDKCIFEAGGEKLNYPYSLSVEEYFNNPFFPAVFKNESANGGIDKFLIETSEQLDIIKKLYFDSPNKEIKSDFESCIFQQLIETPSKYKTYMRILMSASGDVMGASLKYSKVEEVKRSPKGVFEQYFWNPESKYFLNCKGMFNYYSDGGNISFYQPKYSSEKSEILKSHGIDPNNPQIPSDVMEVASSIVQKCNPQLGIICGIDFILNEKDNKWYYLENQAFPAIEEWASRNNIRLNPIKNENDYIKYLIVELEARYEALMMYMNKKNSLQENRQKVK